MMRFVVTCGLALLGACVSHETPVDTAVEQAIADSTRLDAHRERDATRRPEIVLPLLGAGPGDRVAELAAGSGYYAGLLSRLVGPHGRVYAVDPAPIFEHFPNAKNVFPQYLETDPLPNVEYLVSDLDRLAFPEPLDAVLMALYYHDTVWTGEDRAAMNRALYRALRPGGRLVIIDHQAVPGAGEQVTRELHRGFESMVRNELPAAGFRLIQAHQGLRNPDDPRDISVFEPSIRGKTDRFVLVFERPG